MSWLYGPLLQGGNESAVTGTLAQTTADAASAADGLLGVYGTLAQTTADATSAASGEILVTGTLAHTLADSTLAASGSAGLSIPVFVHHLRQQGIA